MTRIRPMFRSILPAYLVCHFESFRRVISMYYRIDRLRSKHGSVLSFFLDSGKMQQAASRVLEQGRGLVLQYLIKPKPNLSIYCFYCISVLKAVMTQI